MSTWQFATALYTVGVKGVSIAHRMVDSTCSLIGRQSSPEWPIDWFLVLSSVTQIFTLLIPEYFDKYSS